MRQYLAAVCWIAFIAGLVLAGDVAWAAGLGGGGPRSGGYAQVHQQPAYPQRYAQPDHPSPYYQQEHAPPTHQDGSVPQRQSVYVPQGYPQAGNPRAGYPQAERPRQSMTPYGYPAYGGNPRADGLPASVQRIQSRTGGQVLRAQPYERDGREIYRVKVLTPQGRIRVYEDDPDAPRAGAAPIYDPIPQRVPPRNQGRGG